jgi:polyisoprenyl-phosphate glycosyltransferase
LDALGRRDSRVKIIALARNFGQQAALTAGLHFSTGDAVIVMDADLQNPPEMLGAFLQKWQEGYAIVYTIRRGNPDASWAKTLMGSLFYRIFKHLTGIGLAFNAADFKLLDRKVVDALRAMPERSRFLRGLIAWTGYPAAAIPFDAPPRHAGQTKYTWGKMLRLAVDGLVSFSTRPLYWAIYIGFTLSFLGCVEILYALLTRFVTHRALPGWTSLIIWISMVGGLQLMLLGVSAIYIAKIFEEVKGRPLYLIGRLVGFPARGAAVLALPGGPIKQEPKIWRDKESSPLGKQKPPATKSRSGNPRLPTRIS